MKRHGIGWALPLLLTIFFLGCEKRETEKQGDRTMPRPKAVAERDRQTSPTVTLAIAPIVNASKRWVDQSTLMREFFPVAVESVLGPAVKVVEPQEVLKKMEAAAISRTESAGDESLAALAKSLTADYLLSWEPHQDEQLNPFLRVRLVNAMTGEIAYVEDFHSGADVAFYVVFLNLYRDNLLKVADGIAREMKLPALPSQSTSTRDLCARAMKAVEQALVIEHPVAIQRQLKTRALALATAAAQFDENDPQVRETHGFALWLNGFEGQALNQLKEMENLTPPARELLGLLQGKPPEQQTGTARSANPEPLTMEIRKRRLRQWWREDEMRAQETPADFAHLMYALTLLDKTQAKEAMKEFSTFNSREFVLGKGGFAERLRKAVNGGSAAEREYALAQAQEAWLAAFELAKFKPSEGAAIGEAFGFAEELFASSAAIATARARLHETILPDLKARNESLADALKVDPEYVPAAQMQAAIGTLEAPAAQRYAIFEQVRALEPFDSKLVCWTAARVAEAGDTGRAQTLLTQARSLSPRDAEAYLQLLHLFWREQLQTVSEKTVEEAVAYYPQTPEMMLEVARIHYENKRPQQAESIARALWQKHPSRIEVAMLLSKVIAFQGRVDEAVAVLDQAVKMNSPAPDKIEAMLQKVDLLMQNNQHPAAVEAAVALVAYAPDHHEARLELGLAQAANGQADEALLTLEGLYGTPYHSRAALEAGKILIERKSLDETLKLAVEAQEAQPQSPWGYKLQADVELARGNRRGAFEAMAKLAGQENAGAFADVAGSRVLNALGMHEKAIASARQGLAKHNPAAEAALLKEIATAALKANARELAGDAFQRLEHVHFDDPEAAELLADR